MESALKIQPTLGLGLESPQSTVAQPFLRWAGGKRRVMPMLMANMPKDFNGLKTRVFEPFLGGGAFSFALSNSNSKFFTPGKNLIINDVNRDLVLAYLALRDNPDALITQLKKITRTKSKSEFERVKYSNPKDDLSRAARFIYLNRTCFNGLWRVNSKGEFNVPWGNLQDPLIYSEENFFACSKSLQRATITNLDFASALQRVSPNDFVYLDPPYIPLTNSSSFSKYAKNDFGIMQHFALAGVIRRLVDVGAKVMLSNSDTKLTQEIYGSVLKIKRIKVQRSISAKASSRVAVGEIIATNF